jgi:hypothetical protein
MLMLNLDLQRRDPEPVNKCPVCGGNVLFYPRDGGIAPFLSCGSCHRDWISMRDIGWIDAMFRADEAALRMVMTDAIREHLEDALALARTHKHPASQVKYLLANLILMLRDDELNDLFAAGDLGDQMNAWLNTVMALRPTESAASEFIERWHETTRTMQDAFQGAAQ